MSAVVVAVLVGSAALLAVRRPTSLDAPAATPPRPDPAVPKDDVGLLLRLRIPLSCLGFVAGWAFVGGAWGLAAGAVAGALSWRVLGRAEGPAARRRREQLARDLPVGVQLLASCLASGAAVGPALEVVADALPGPMADELLLLHHRLALGADPAGVWRELGAHPQLGPLGRALGRTQESGASVVAAIEALAADLRARADAEVEERARSVDVRAAAPLGACFLPAFLLLGVVPLVVGIFSSMDLFG